MRRFLLGGFVGASALLVWGALSGRPIPPFNALLASLLACWLVLQAGPRSIFERCALIVTASLMAWAAGTGSIRLVDALLGWGLAGLAVAAVLRPRA